MYRRTSKLACRVQGKLFALGTEFAAKSEGKSGKYKWSDSSTYLNFVRKIGVVIQALKILQRM